MENQAPIVPAVTPQVVVEQPKPNNFLVILLSILLFISLTIAGFFAYQTQQLVNELRVTRDELKQTPTSTPGPTYEPGTEPEPVPLEILIKDWKTLKSDQFSFSLNYPLNWKYYKNAKTNELNLPYIRNLSAMNETIINPAGCAVHFGFGGGSSPSNNIQEDNKTIDNLVFLEKTWLDDQNDPIFVSYLLNRVSPSYKKFELLYAWISKVNSVECQQQIDQILSTFKFLD